MNINYCSIGCKVNQYECEALINLFLENGFVFNDCQSDNDVFLINTCSVTNTSEMKSRKMIRQIARNNPNAVIVVMGCYSQIKTEEIEKIDEVDLIFGTSNRVAIFQEVKNLLENKKTSRKKVADVKDFIEYENLEIDKFLDKTRAFVKIEDGCENFCSYCIIPYTRGKIKSRNPENVIKEIKKIVQNGVKEIVLTGINIGCYGVDLENFSLETLIERIITEVKGDYRLRISSIEITKITDSLIKLMAIYPQKICKHLHIPLQSGNDRILDLMNRKYNFEFYFNKIINIRKILPDINITTDIIIGFPTETNEEFKDTYDKTALLAFGEIHVFTFSNREGTKASLIESNIPASVLKERSKKLINLSKKMALDYRKKSIGKIYDVLIEKIDGKNCFGHTENYLFVQFKNICFDVNQVVKVVINEATYPISIGEYYEVQ
ncbi:MAG: tRNA (N(6)-L-threonylcarbamoyladenosine(37)-C(2))-methylthiotransferase MtaB [Bacilli bacterium]|nr:tRNA (N(6)-L-threonylcarbamoyladenosine(37)-C(2))-methylthiotransferase MtaB [Bacilli bacterium]